MKLPRSLLILTELGLCLGLLPYMPPPADETSLLTEGFVYEDTLEFTFFSQTVSWEEALVICQYYDSNLAVVDDVNKAVFLAGAIAESNIRLEDIWIGGRARKGDWLWYPTNQVLNSESDEDGFPPWVRPPIKSTKECLSMDRKGHDNPLFLDVDCRLKKPFICEKGVGVKTDRPLPSKWVRINGRLFVLYHGRLSWRDALSFCWQHGLRLAVVSSNYETRQLAEAMIHTRPDFENLWIGATSQFGTWTWVGTGETLPNHPDSTGYPPWKERRAVRSRSKNCLVLDRHLCENVTFIATSCDRTRDFACEEVTAEDKPFVNPSEISFNHKGRNMTLIMKEVTWWEADRTCESRGGRLVVLLSGGVIDAILTVMADLAQELKHVWVGGRRKGKQWMWTSENEAIPEKNQGGFPPWCETDPELRTECLNLDKREHTRPLMYGLPCYTKQPFVCEEGCDLVPYVKNGRWDCRLGDVVGEKVCKIHCSEGFTAMGNPALRCDPNSGSWRGDDSTRMLPQCQRMSDVTFSLLKVISRYEKSLGFLFVLNAAREDPVFTAAALQLVNAIVASFPLSSSRRAGLISCNTLSSVVIPYGEQDSCLLRHKLQAVSLKHSTSISFTETVDLISAQTRTTQGGAKTIIFFLSSVVDLHTKANAALLAPLTKEGHAVFTIDVGVAENAKETPLATVGPLLRLNHFRFAHAHNLTEVAIFMTGESYENPNDCKVPALLPGVKVQDLDLPRWLLFRVTNLTMRDLNAMKKKRGKKV